MNKKGYLSVGAMILGTLVPWVQLSAVEGGSLADGKDMQAIYSVEYLYPTEEDRNIRTVNVNAYYLFGGFEKINLSLYAGLTGTYADGDITQLEGSLDKGTLREVNYENSAVGVGPGLLVDIRLFRANRFAFHLNGSGSFILYNKNFPEGGDYYNFMWRAGPVLRYSLGGQRVVGLGYQWMHVSNGQGVEAKNPSYDAQGVTFFYTGAF